MRPSHVGSASLLLVALLFAGGAAHAGPRLNQQQPMPTPKTVALAKSMANVPANRPISQPMVVARQQVLSKEQQLKTYVTQQMAHAIKSQNNWRPAPAAQYHFDAARGNRQLARFYVKVGDRAAAAQALRQAATSYRDGAQQLQIVGAKGGAIKGMPALAKAHNAEIAATRFDRKAAALEK